MTQTPDKQSDRPKSVLRCFTGSLISGTIASAAYGLTRSISATFAAKPIHSENLTAIKISIAVRTLVMGMCALATFVFALSALGLLALGIQRLVQQFAKAENVKP
ncbi:DUF3082 domain-containing protein [Oscillatoriales cyanobacterium LEGE 11467]|uniref:DUF3082 domain-containing protein n=2 Tax=Zarconia TaxID=2992130 RepID=A0A928VYW6_9CYAN|nr:DUF3082 domain-containing protein [Zarconia navalis LEGE 11467]